VAAKSKSQLISWTKELESLRTLSLRQPWAWPIGSDVGGSPRRIRPVADQKSDVKEQRNLCSYIGRCKPRVRYQHRKPKKDFMASK
jgi:hypothetical protein